MVYTYRQDTVHTGQLGEIRSVSSVSSADSIRLSWTRPFDGPTPDKYYIYRAGWADHRNVTEDLVPGPYTLIDSTTDTVLSDAPAQQAGIFYSYSVRPVKDGQPGIMSVPAYSRRPVPMGLIATVYSRQEVRLKWAADTAADVAGYNVYRFYGRVPNDFGALEKLNSALVGPKPVFIDSTVQITGDSIVSYVVTTVNQYGHESGLSPRADSRIDRIMGSWADTINTFLHWSPTMADTFQEYQVWVQPVGSFENGVSVTLRAFPNVHDTFRLVSAVNWHYKVMVINAIGQDGHFSDLVPWATIADDNKGMYRGDGMLQPPAYDPFWDRVGLAPDELALEQPFSGEYSADKISLSV